MMWTEDQVSVIREMMWEGKTDKEITRRLGTTESAVMRKRSRLGLKKRLIKPVSVNSHQYRAITKALDAGWTWKRISEHAFINKDTLRKAYHKAMRSGEFDEN